jgi:ubiquinone/menaquinone biosynthesis C-methylase UbiE
MSLAKFFIHSVGKLSDGIALCLKEGLTSGKMLDYIYKNKPSGKGIIGKWIDSFFLKHPGWEGVRKRRENLEALFLEAIREREGPLKILDVAAGMAGYIFSTLKKADREDLQVICQDIEPRWVEEGNARGAKNVTFQLGDAFDPALAQLKSDIVIASGFYDWINDDEKIAHSIKLIAQALPIGGAFILTIQSAHPNLALTEKVFSDFNHQPLKMTMRSFDQLKTWLENRGFLIEKVLSDSWGYYTVIKGKKR